MWTRVFIRAEIVWEDVIYHAHAIWHEEGADEPVVLEKDGRCPLPDGGGPDEALYAAVHHMQGRPYHEPGTPPATSRGGS